MSTEKKIRVLVTGATGFLGSNILRAMALQPGVEPIAACRRRELNLFLPHDAVEAKHVGRPFPISTDRHDISANRYSSPEPVPRPKVRRSQLLFQNPRGFIEAVDSGGAAVRLGGTGIV